MSNPTLLLLERQFERQKRLFELRTDALGREIGREIGRHIASFERTKDEIERKLEQKFEVHRRKFGATLEEQKRRFEVQIRRFEERKSLRLDDEVRFIRSWIEKPLTTGAVTPSGRALARTMASYVDPASDGPVIELGPGTGPVTEALVAQGVDPARLVLVEYDRTFCRLLRERYPAATVVQGDAYSLGRLLGGLLQQPAAAIVSGLPLFNKPLRMRLRLLFEGFALMSPGSPFVQFTYNAVAPIPKRLDRVTAEASERIWMNIPPARVWVYRRD